MFVKRSFKTAINIYLLALVSLLGLLTFVHTNFLDHDFVFCFFLGLIFFGWFYFLFQVTTTRKLRFDTKMVWFIGIFSVFFIAAPLFAFIVLKNNHQK